MKSKTAPKNSRPKQPTIHIRIWFLALHLGLAVLGLYLVLVGLVSIDVSRLALIENNKEAYNQAIQSGCAMMIAGSIVFAGTVTHGVLKYRKRETHE